MTVDEMLDQQRTTSERSDMEGSEEAGGAFGIIRAPRERALMIELRKKDGTILAVPYAMIEQIRYTPEEGITVHAGTLEVHMRGRQLTGNGSALAFFSALASHRVTWVREQFQTLALQPSDGTTVIECITW